MASSWIQIKSKPELIHHLGTQYTSHLPIIIRDLFANWIEQQPWESVHEENFEVFGQRFIRDFTEHLNAKISSVDIDLETRNHLLSYRSELSRTNPYHFAKYIKSVIQTERNLLDKMNYRIMPNNRNSHVEASVTHVEIENILTQIKIKCKESESLCNQITQCQEQTTIDYGRLKDMEEILRSQANAGQTPLYLNKLKQKKELEKGVEDSLACIVNMLKSLPGQLQKNYLLMDHFQEHWLEGEIQRWLRCQQLAGNGASMENGNLDQLQAWSEHLLEAILNDCRTIGRAQHLLTTSLAYIRELYNLESTLGDLNGLNESYTGLIVKITQKTFIIEKQPPQVMKTNTRFTSTVRLLVGVKANLHQFPPRVDVSIISEAQASNLVRCKDSLTDSMLKECAGEILNNHGPMEYNSISNQLSLNLRNMQLKKIRRTEKKGTESVMDEKFALLFLTRFKIGDQLYRAWTLSLPVVAVVHGNQEPHAWATVTWDNAFAEKNRLPFSIPDKVVWSKVGEVLSTKFKNSISKGLSKENLKFLAGKVFRNQNIGDYDNVPLSWSLFSKEAIPDQSFTFWEWFYALFKLTKDHLSKLWQDDLITFITKRQAEELLIDRPPGTFILRFSDSELGGVTVCFRDDDRLSPHPVVHVQPFTSNDLKIKGLADRVYDIKQLVNFYPDRPKDAAFGKYYTQSLVSEIQSNGYVRPELVTQIRRLAPTSASYSNENRSNNLPNEFQMIDYSMHQFSNGAHENGAIPSAMSNGTLSNGNGFAGLPDTKFSVSLPNPNSSVPNAPMDCPDLTNFLPSINDEDLAQFDSSSLNSSLN